MRHYKSKEPVTLDLLNSILAIHGFSVNEAEFDLFKSIKGVELPYPLPNNDPYTHSVVGPTTKRKAHMCCYILTVKQDGRQYVGSSSNISMRLRTYYNTKSESGRTMAGVMSNLGPSGFNLKVLIIPLHNFSLYSAMTDAYRAKLILALEQYLILDVKPVLNDMVVVGGGQTKNLEGTLELAATAANSKPLYVYTPDKSRLLYIASSRIRFEEDVGVNTKTQGNHVKDGTPLLGTYMFTEDLVEGAILALMTTAELRDAMKSLYLVKVTKHPVKLKLTDLWGSDPLFFDSKAQAHAFTVRKGRPVGKTYLTSLPCTQNGWFVE